MTVRELLEKLGGIEDKDQPVYIPWGYGYCTIGEVTELEEGFHHATGVYLDTPD